MSEETNIPCRRGGRGRRSSDHQDAECPHFATIQEMSDFLEAWKLKEQRKAEMWETIKTQVFGWGIVAIMGSIGAWVADNLLHIPTHQP